MCGIVGWLLPPGVEPAPAVLNGMMQEIWHRGPDDHGTYRKPASGLALGHLRLSIIDLTTSSRQPMTDKARGVTLIYNGELYNFRTLRKELQSLGHLFVSDGDSEVVLRAYEEYGARCVDRVPCSSGRL